MKIILFKPRFVIKSMRHLNQEHGSMVRIQVLSSYSVLVRNKVLILNTFYYFKKEAGLKGQFYLQVPLRPPMVFLFDPALCEKVVLLLLLFLLLIFFVIDINSSCLTLWQVYRSAGPQPVRPGFDSLSFVQVNERTRIKTKSGHKVLPH